MPIPDRKNEPAAFAGYAQAAGSALVTSTVNRLVMHFLSSLHLHPNGIGFVPNPCHLNVISLGYLAEYLTPGHVIRMECDANLGCRDGVGLRTARLRRQQVAIIERDVAVFERSIYAEQYSQIDVIRVELYLKGIAWPSRTRRSMAHRAWFRLGRA